MQRVSSVLTGSMKQRLVLCPVRTTMTHRPHPKNLKWFGTPWPEELKAKHIPVKGEVKGHIQPYLASANRDKRYADNSIPGMYGDTTARFFKNVFVHNWELYPLFVAVGIACTILTVGSIMNFRKIDIHLNRHKRDSPLDWERCRDYYYKNHAVHFDIGHINQRMPEWIEALNDELVEAAYARGTR